MQKVPPLTMNKKLGSLEQLQKNLHPPTSLEQLYKTATKMKSSCRPDPRRMWAWGLLKQSLNPTQTQPVSTGVGN